MSFFHRGLRMHEKNVAWNFIIKSTLSILFKICCISVILHFRFRVLQSLQQKKKRTVKTFFVKVSHEHCSMNVASKTYEIQKYSDSNENEMFGPCILFVISQNMNTILSDEYGTNSLFPLLRLNKDVYSTHRHSYSSFTTAMTFSPLMFLIKASELQALCFPLLVQ